MTEKAISKNVIVEVVAAVDKSTNHTPKRKWMQIGVIAVILIVVVGIYFMKSEQNKKIAVPDVSQTEDAAQEKTDNTILKITSVKLDEIKQYGLPTVIDFGSDSCIPCKEMAPVLETLNEEWQGKAIVHFMDVWKYTDGVSDFPVSVIPTQVFFNADGTPFVPSDSLASQIEFTMYADKEGGEHIFTAHQGGVTEEQMRLIFAEMGVE